MTVAATPLLTGLPATLPTRLGAGHGWERCLVQLLPCEFCGYEFDHDGLGRFGCPNCHGEGLDDAEQMRLQPGRRRPPAILPLVSSGTRATESGNNLRGGMVGKLVNEGHGQTVSPKNKSAMRKIILAKRPQCGQIVRVSQPQHQMKTYTIIEKETEYTVQASSQIKAMAIHFGCERPVKCMSYGGTTQLWGNRRYSKNTSEGYRSAKFKA